MILFFMMAMGLTGEIPPYDFIVRKDLAGYQRVLENNLEKNPSDFHALTFLSLSKSCSVFLWDPFCIANDESALNLANKALKINSKYYLAFVARYVVTNSASDLQSAKSLNPSWPYFLRIEALKSEEKGDWKKVNYFIDQYLEKEQSQFKNERAASALCATFKFTEKDRGEVEKLITRGMSLLKNENWWELDAYFYCLYAKQYHKPGPFSKEDELAFKKAEKMSLKSTDFYRLKIERARQQRNFKLCSEVGKEGIKKSFSIAVSFLSCLIDENNFREAEKLLHEIETSPLSTQEAFQYDILKRKINLLIKQDQSQQALDAIQKQKKSLTAGQEEDLLLSVYLAHPMSMKDGFAGMRKLYQKRAAKEEKYSIEYYNQLAEMIGTGLNWGIDPIDLMKILDSYTKADRAHRFLKSDLFLTNYETVFMKVNRNEDELLKVYDRWIKLDPKNKSLQTSRLMKLLLRDISYKKEAEEFVKDLPEDSLDRLYIEAFIARNAKDEKKELDLLHRIALRTFSSNSITNYLNRVEKYKGDKKALRVFEDFVEDNKLDMNNDKLLAEHAYRLNKVGEKEKAIELLKKAEVINPYNALVLANIALIYAKDRQCKKSIPYAQKAAKLVAIFDEVGSSLENIQLVCGGPKLKYGHLYVFN